MENNSPNQIQNNFFSKETISGFNKILLQKTALPNLSSEGKKEIITILIKNMKLVYKSMDTDKINNNNFTSIFEQFKKFSISESLLEINKSNIINLQQSSTDLKFARDFNSNPNNGNKLMNRPESTKINQKDTDIFMPNDLLNDNTYQSNLDYAFRPIVDNNQDNTFNNYSFGKGSDSKQITEKINDIQQFY